MRGYEIKNSFKGPEIFMSLRLSNTNIDGS